MEFEGRRRIDRVTSPAYLEGLGDADLATVRSMRDDCREEEAGLSYARRVVHGQLDIVRAEQRQRGGGDDEGLVSTLTDILADEPANRGRQLRDAPIYVPDDHEYGQRSHDTLIDDSALGRVPELDDAELAALLERLEEKERHVSSLRRTVLDNLDRLQDELIARFRDGSANVDDVVASAVAATPDEPRD